MWHDPAVAALLTVQTIAVISLGAFLGSLAVGGAGFAFALTASAVWLHVLDPVHTTALVVACGTILQTSLMWPLRHSIERRRLWPFLLGGLIGIPLGVLVLVRTDTGALKIALGVFIALYGAYALFAPRLPRVESGGRLADGAVGFVGGVLGGLGGYSGVLPTIWTQLRGWDKDTARGVFQPFILFAHVGTLVLVGSLAFDAAGLVALLIALPALALGGWLGWHIYGRLDERRFRQVLASLLIVSGVMLAI